jgi:hypothetical protein
MNRMIRRHFVSSLSLALSLTMLAAPAPAQLLNEALLNGLTYRSLGPYRAGASGMATPMVQAPAR